MIASNFVREQFFLKISRKLRTQNKKLLFKSKMRSIISSHVNECFVLLTLGEQTKLNYNCGNNNFSLNKRREKPLQITYNL